MAAMTIVYIVYAVILVGGGIMGFVKAGSKASLIAGLVMGAIAANAAFVHHQESGVGPGLVIGASVSLVGSTFFLIRYVKTKKAMPAMPMMIISDIVLIASLVFIFARK